MANVIGTLRTTQSFGRRAAVAKIVIRAKRATEARLAGAHGARSSLAKTSSALRLWVYWAIGFEDVRPLGRHICTWLIQGNGRLAVVLCGMDEGIDFGRGPHQAGLADPAAGAACLASVPKPDHDDHTSSAGRRTHCRPGHHPELVWLHLGVLSRVMAATAFRTGGLAYGMDAAETSLLARQ
jgi:hypothetical protein